MMQLQRQRGAGLHLDALDLEAGRFLQHRVRAPGPRDRLVQPVGLVAARLQLADDVLHALQVIAMRDQHGVGRVDDDQVLDADGRDDAIVGMDVGAAGLDRDALALAAVAVAASGADSSAIACHEPTSLQSNVPRTTATPPSAAAFSITA